MIGSSIPSSYTQVSLTTDDVSPLNCEYASTIVSAVIDIAEEYNAYSPLSSSR